MYLNSDMLNAAIQPATLYCQDNKSMKKKEKSIISENKY